MDPIAPKPPMNPIDVQTKLEAAFDHYTGAMQAGNDEAARRAKKEGDRQAKKLWKIKRREAKGARK